MIILIKKYLNKCEKVNKVYIKKMEKIFLTYPVKTSLFSILLINDNIRVTLIKRHKSFTSIKFMK